MTTGEIEIVPVRKQTASVTPAMRVALRASTVVFHLGALAQVTMLLWIALLAGLTAGAGGILGHTGGLDKRTFASSMYAAVGLDALLLVGIALVWMERLAPSDEPARERSFTERHPVIGAGLWLLGALVVTTAASWHESPYFPESWATVVVLANVIFLTLVGAVVTASLLGKLLEVVRVHALASQYRAGAVTATLAVIGLAGGASWFTGVQEQLAEDGEKEYGLGQITSVDGLPSRVVRALCIGGEQIDDDLEHRAEAPACRFLVSGADASEGEATEGPSGADAKAAADCFRELKPTLPRTSKWLERRFQIGTDHADDAATYAAVETCLRDPLPDNKQKFFTTTAWRRALRLATELRRSEPCNDWERVAAPACDDPYADEEERANELWRQTRCALKPKAAEVILRKFQLRQRDDEIAQEMGIDKDQVKNIYDYALKKLREAGVGRCFRE
jgi:DNA-directed RNA polymerase specialized sigma24 family protein